MSKMNTCLNAIAFLVLVDERQWYKLREELQRSGVETTVDILDWLAWSCLPDGLNADCSLLQDCVMLASTFQENSLRAVQNERGFDSFCGYLPRIRQCVLRHKNSCTAVSERNYALSIRDVAEYLCSRSGRQVALRAQSSPCVSNEGLLEEVENMQRRCFTVFYRQLTYTYLSGFPVQQVCTHVPSLFRCAVYPIEETCGRDFKQFIQNIWTVSLPQTFATLNCPTGSFSPP